MGFYLCSNVGKIHDGSVMRGVPIMVIPENRVEMDVLARLPSLNDGRIVRAGRVIHGAQRHH